MGQIFGTDGIRGKANVYPMTPELALKLGKAIAYIFRYKKTKGRPKFIIGKDTRLSGYMFENALTAGLVSMGAEVILVGPMPSPALGHLTKSLNANAGLVISASHNPSSDNGIKIFSSDGTKLPDRIETEIEQYLLDKMDIPNNITGEKIGRAFRVEDARGRYIEFAKSTINNISLEGFKVVLDCANGAAYYVAPRIFEELGAEIIVLGNHPDGLNINKDCGALHPRLVQKYVKKNNADVGIALDGDADRVIMVDEKGQAVDGDSIMTIAALDMLEKGELTKNTLVVTHYTNLAVDKLIEKNHGKVIRVKNGDRYVIEEMLKSGYSLGGEQTGHIIFADHTTTGDGTIAALKILRIMKRKNMKLSQLASVLKKYPQTIINVEVSKKPELSSLPSLMAKIHETENALEGRGRLLIRYSGTQNILRIMVEGPDKNETTKIAESIAEKAKKLIGK